MALATPDLEYGFPHGEYSPFFWGHSLILLAVSYVLIVRGERPYLSDIPKVIGTTLGLLVAVYVINLIIGFPELVLGPKRADVPDHPRGSWTPQGFF